MFTIERYINESGVDVFGTWLRGLRDRQAMARVYSRLERAAQGNLGDCKLLQNGVWELRVDYGPGYRVYYGMIGKRLVLLLGGGDKRTQHRDIMKAITCFEDYKRKNI